MRKIKVLVVDDVVVVRKIVTDTLGLAMLDRVCFFDGEVFKGSSVIKGEDDLKFLLGFDCRDTGLPALQY